MRTALALLLLPGLAFSAPNGPEGAERILDPVPVKPMAATTPPPEVSDSLVAEASPRARTTPAIPTDTSSRSMDTTAVAATGDFSPTDSAKATATVPDTTPKAILPLAPKAPAPTVFVPTTTAKPAATFRTIAIGIDTTGRSRTGRSTWTAVGLTMLLPGAGHRYLGHKTGAAVWMTTDLVNWSALLVAARLGTMYIEDATEIANRHAGADLDADADPAFLEVVRDWRSRRPVQGRRDSYDEALLQQGLATDVRFPNDAAHDWDWGSPENPENNRNIANFEDALKGYRTSRVVLSYAAGALLLSRAVAVADILRIRRKSASRAGLQAVVVPGPDGGTAVLSLRF